MIRRMRGFTLIELIIVVIIIGILAAIAAPMMQTMQAKAIAGEAMNGCAAVANSLQQYYAQYGVYPFQTSPGATISVTLYPSWLPGLAIRSGSGCYGNTDSTGGVWPSLDGTYFSQDCYMAGCNGNNCTILVNIFSGSDCAPKKQDALNTGDSPQFYLWYNPTTKKFTQQFWSKTGL